MPTSLIPRACRTRQLLYRGIVVTINTGLWTAVLSIVDLVLVISSLILAEGYDLTL